MNTQEILHTRKWPGLKLHDKLQALYVFMDFGGLAERRCQHKDTSNLRLHVLGRPVIPPTLAILDALGVDEREIQRLEDLGRLNIDRDLLAIVLGLGGLCRVARGPSTGRH